MNENTRSWTVTVTTTPTMIAPAFTKNPLDCPILAYPGGPIVINPGDYWREYGWDGSAEHGKLYWSPNGGNSEEANAPTHSYGCQEYPDGVIWVVVGLSRNYLDLSADVENPIFVTDNGAENASAEAGLKLDEYRPAYTYENFNGEVWGIAESGDATIGVKER